jgi:hypothetical protein
MPWITVESGESSYQVWEPDAQPTPVSAATDPELPAADTPPPPPSNTSTTASNNAATTGSGVTPPNIPNTTVVNNSQLSYVDRGLVEGSPEWVARYQQEYVTQTALGRQTLRDVAQTIIGTYDGGIVTVQDQQPDGKLRTLLVVGDGRGGQTTVDITDQLAARAAELGYTGPPHELQPVKVDPTTTTVTSPQGRQIQIQAPPVAPTVVTTSQGQITVDPNSEVARFIQWQQSQYGQFGTQTVGQNFANQGVYDPYSNPAVVEQALAEIARANRRNELYATSGQAKPDTAPWNDPNWPLYQGSNKEAYDTASVALTDVNARNNLMRENGWDQATFNSWALRITDPDEWGRQAAAYDAANGIVAGPQPNASTSLSSNGTTVVTTTGVNSSGFPNVSVSGVSTNNLVSTATGAVAGATATVQSVNTLLTTPPQIDPSKVFSGLSGAAAAAAGLTTATNLIGNILKTPTQLPTSVSPFVQAATDAIGLPNLSAVENLFNNQASTLSLAQAQATLQARYNQSASTDWRVRLQLAPGADYLYKDPEPGILAPLFDTDGVLFPYTPNIDTSYAASYDKYDLTHSNYRGYFYKGSAVNDINLRATFTAQDTQEANYMLAVIHFFRSVTKMFYGQDAIRGAPPPLVYLTGFGEYQFNQHPCLVASFNYTLPSDVDYIRALAPNNYGNLFSQRDRTGSTSGGFLGSTATRLLNAGLNALNPTQPNVPSPSYIPNAVNGTQQATYVPTKIDISLTLLPTNTRSQVSQQFSLKDFANGNLIKGGFW